MCSFRGVEVTDCDLCRPLDKECSWKERLGFAVDLPAPYLDEKLSDWRGLRANMVQSQCKFLSIKSPRARRIRCSETLMSTCAGGR